MIAAFSVFHKFSLTILEQEFQFFTNIHFVVCKYFQ